MESRDYRKLAREHLKGNRQVFALMWLTFVLISACCVVAVYVGSVVQFFISGTIIFGFSVASLKVARKQKLKVEDMFCGFKNYFSTFCLNLINSVLLVLWFLLGFVPMIIKNFSYSMSPFILMDNPDIGANEARKKSVEMMKGHKWDLNCLEFSFVGWFILSILTCGILFLWVLPYFETAVAEFYEHLKNSNETSLEDKKGLNVETKKQRRTKKRRQRKI